MRPTILALLQQKPTACDSRASRALIATVNDRMLHLAVQASSLQVLKGASVCKVVYDHETVIGTTYRFRDSQHPSCEEAPVAEFWRLLDPFEKCPTQKADLQAVLLECAGDIMLATASLRHGI